MVERLAAERNLTDAEWADLLGKFEKIAELERRGATEHEAAAAAAMFAKLLTRHNLERAEIESRMGRTEDWKADSVTVDMRASWRHWFVQRTAEQMSCRAVQFGPRAQIIGESRNIQACLQLIRRVLDEVERLADLRYAVWYDDKAHLYSWHARPSATAWKRSYRWGAVVAVVDRIKADRAAEIDAFQGGSALVLVDDKRLDGAAREMFGSVVTRKNRSSSFVRDANQQGRADGSAIPLRDAVRG